MACNIDLETGIANCGGSKEFYIEVLEEYEQENKKDELIKAYENKDWKTYTIEVHAIKGTMRLLGAPDAGEIAEKLQFASETSDIATVDSLHGTLLEIMDESIALLKAQL